MTGAYSKYWAFAHTAIKQRIRHYTGLIASCCMLALLVAIFSQLWLVIASNYDLSSYGFTVNNIIWYIALTELVTVTSVRIHKEIEQAVRSGDITYTLNRPVSYLVMKQSEAFGQALFRLPLFMATGFTTAYLFTGQWGIAPQFFFPAILFALMAIFLSHLCYSLIGFSVFWLQESSAPYMVFSKFVFVLGGIYLPIDFFPEWLHTIAVNTPFTAILYAPAHFALSPTWDSAIYWGLRLVFWIIVMIVINAFVMHKSVKSLCVNGG